MDSITNPVIIKVNNRNYRCLHETNFKQRSKPSTPKRRIVIDEYDDEETYIEDFAITEASNLDERLSKCEDFEDEPTTKDDELNEQELDKLNQNKNLKVYQDNGVYVCTVHVPSSCRGYLIGKNCATIKDICAKTKAKVDFPEMHRKDDPFVISSENEQSVLKAYLKISELLQSKRNASSITHFLAIRCVTDEMRTNYENFKQIVKSKYLPQSYPDQVFIGAAKLHLSISIFSLLDNFERNKMVSFMNKSLGKVIKEVLKDHPNVKDNKKYRFKIQGLDYMNDDPTSVNVLYAKVDDKSQFIQQLCNRINTASNELGFTNPTRPQVKLHVTLMNTRYIPRNQCNQFKYFDATAILKELKNHYFGQVDLNEIELLIPGSFDESTGFYKSTHKITVF